MQAAIDARPASQGGEAFDFEQEVHGKKLSEAHNYTKI
jgi:hypothetical protein